MSGSRFRRSAPAGKSLADLGNLIQAASQHSPEPVKGPPVGFGILPEDNDLTCVWKMMSDLKGRTVIEATGALANFNEQVDPEDIEILLRALQSNGFATVQYHSGEAIYTLKKGVSMSSMSGKGKIKMNQAREGLQGLGSEGKVDLSEGIMVCLWKVVADRKARTQTQITEILGTYGINGEVAKNAFIRAKVTHQWFDYHGSGLGTKFKLKGSIKMPTITRVDPATLRHKPTPGAALPMSRRAEDIKQAGQIPAPTSFKPPKVRRYIDIAIQKNLHEEVPDRQLAPPPVQDAVTKDDELDVAIWKVMKDLKQYTASDVGVLLQEYGHNAGTVRARMSQLHLHEGHWFNREKRRSANGGLEYLYTLKATIAKPGTSILPDVPVPTVEVKEENMQKSAAAALGATVSLGEKLEEALQTAPQAPAFTPVTLATPPVEKYFTLADLKDTTLLKFSVEIRGTRYSFKQADQLARDLLSEGFGKGDKRDKPGSLLKKTYAVGNASFTGDQLEDLTAQLVESGFGPEE